MSIHSSPPSRGARRFSSRVLPVLLCTAAVAVTPGKAAAGDPNYRLCFPVARNTPDAEWRPPAVDGTVGTDRGWTGAWRYVFGNGTYLPDVVVQAVRDRAGTSLYLSFEVRNDFHERDRIIIALDPNPEDSEESRRVLLISPFGAEPDFIDERTYDGTYWNTVHGLGATARSARASDLWSVEVRIPIAEYKIRGTGTFDFFFSVYPVNGPAGPLEPTISQFPWPVKGNRLRDDIFASIPARENWGTATLEGMCNGVYILPGDISTNQTPSAKIALNAMNEFRALVHNTSIGPSGAAIQADSIYATFKIYDFGLTNPDASLWNLVPGTGNPTAVQSIAANGTALFTTRWTLTDSQREQYDDHPHQCILVELSSKDTARSTTVFSNRSAWTNMWFGNASRFEHAARVEGRGYGRAPDGSGRHRFDLWVTEQEVSPDSNLWGRPQGDMARRRAGRQPEYAVQPPPGRIESRFVQIVRACRRTGQFVTISGRQYEWCDPVGAYGYDIRHVGRGKGRWRASLAAEGMQRVGEGRFTIRVPENRAVRVTSRIEAEEPGGCFGSVTGANSLALAGGLMLMGLFGARQRRDEGEAS